MQNNNLILKRVNKIISAKNGMDTSRVYYSSEDVSTEKPKETSLNRMLLWNKNRTTPIDKKEATEDTGWDTMFDDVVTPVTQTTTSGQLSSDLTTLLDMFNTAGIKIKVTSGYREGAKTKQGNQSHHSTGNAMDIVPENGDFAALANAIRSNPDISTFMKSKGLGVLDETTTEMLSKTGGTGAHFHIGPDNIAQNFWKV